MTDIKLPPMPRPQLEKAGWTFYDDSDMENYAREAVRLNATVLDGWPTDADLTAIYKQANGEDVGKPQPLTTARIFKAMRAMLSAAPAAPQPAQQPLTVPDAQEKDLLQAIQERDAADDYIDALLDEVLGTDRPEWSSAYGHADAMEQVRETMGALMKPCVDKAWDRFQSALAAPAAPAQPLDLGVMELAESVGLIGPASRTDDLHEAIQRFHDLIVVNASIKAARHFADGLAPQPPTDEKDALDLLAVLFDAYENGPSCYEDPDGMSVYIGTAIKIDDDTFKKCVDLLNRRRPRILTEGVKND